MKTWKSPSAKPGRPNLTFCGMSEVIWRERRKWGKKMSGNKLQPARPNLSSRDLGKGVVCSLQRGVGFLIFT